MNILFDFFNESICAQSKSTDLESCYKEFYKRMNENNEEGFVEINISFEAQMNLYHKLKQSTIDEIWSISLSYNGDGDSFQRLTYY